ncbi:MAG: ABC transporter permease [Firmicutes bacterium]|nr:ABC transporter permease [Bacillota bacterium]
MSKSLTGTLALQQLKIAKRRTIWTLLGIALSLAMLTAVNGFAASAMEYLAIEGRPVYFRERIGLLVIALVLGGVIAAAAVIVISNAFRVSAGERTRQFGILKSVGATKAQVMSIIMYEAVYLGVGAIPAGVAVGILVNFFVLRIINNMLRPIASLGNDFSLPFTISVWALLGAVAASFAVVLLSAWLPAEKAARHPAVAALFHSDNVKVKKLRTLGISRLLFGVEGHLAAKQMKRSRRNYRATVLSLTISIVLLLATVSLRDNLLLQWRVMNYDGIYANVVFNTRRSVEDIPPEIIETLTARMKEFPGAVVRGYSHSLLTTYINGERENIRVMAVAPEIYSRVVREAGVPYGSNVLINVRNETDVLGITRQTHPFGHLVGENLAVTTATSFGYWGHRYAEDPPDVFVHGQIRHLPEDILFSAFFEISIIVPSLPIGSYYWFIQTGQAREFIDFLGDVRQEYFSEISNMSVFIGSLDERALEVQTLTNIITLLVYGFATMLTLIALTNVISTISTNTRIRAREFAMLTSVGMTPGGIRRMLALESLISSVRALLFGLPLGMLAAWGVYLGTQMDRVRFGFIIPWQMMLICIGGIFIVTFITTRFSAARLRKESVVETIRAVV